MRFEWDPAKDATNRRKHGIAFADAIEIFRSPSGWYERFDESHSGDEDRFIAMGAIRRGIAVVVFVERDEDTLRLISARPADARETRVYHRWLRSTLP